MKYPQYLQVRLTEEDMQQLTKASEQLDLPRGALVRKAWREWLVRQSNEKIPVT